MTELVLKVEKTWLETPTIPAIRLNLSENRFAFKAGQYGLIAIKINEQWEDHAFSIACAPNQNFLEAKKISGSTAAQKSREKTLFAREKNSRRKTTIFTA